MCGSRFEAVEQALAGAEPPHRGPCRGVRIRGSGKLTSERGEGSRRLANRRLGVPPLLECSSLTCERPLMPVGNSGQGRRGGGQPKTEPGGDDGQCAHPSFILTDARLWSTDEASTRERGSLGAPVEARFAQPRAKRASRRPSVGPSHVCELVTSCRGPSVLERLASDPDTEKESESRE